MRWLGAILVLAGCGGFGFSIAMEQYRETRLLKNIREVLEFMQWELSYRLTPLPELCAMAGRQAGGEAGILLQEVSELLTRQMLPDAASCMQQALQKHPALSPRGRRLLGSLGSCLGRFDLPGQLEGLESLKETCGEELKKGKEDQAVRLRSYETLGLCAGAALVILLI